MHASVVYVFFSSLPLVLAIRGPLNTQSNGVAAFDCGKPYGPCGTAIPANVTCSKGAGWCQTGYFCGWEHNTGEPSRCLPLPMDCGQTGSPCCPSNTDSPHTSLDDKLKRKPFCKDGSTCFYFAPVPGLNNGDMFAANKGAYACSAIPQECGTGAGSPCCPYTYKVATNPPLQRYGCPGKDTFCNYDRQPMRNTSDVSLLPGFASGTCELNGPNCGQFGKACCVYTSGAATGTRCGPQFGQAGRKGYCANPPGFKGPNMAPYKDLVCTECPDNVDANTKDTNPELFFSCRSV